MNKSCWIALLTGLISLSSLAETWEFKGDRSTLLIDVRTSSEYAAGHIEGAINIPLDSLADRIQAVAGTDKDRPILLYCRSGRRSAIAKMELEKQGYRRIQDGGSLTALHRSLKNCSAQSC